MDLQDECTLSFYEELTPMDTKDEHQIFLVKQCNTGKLYIKKYLKEFDDEVYKALMDHPHQNIPKIEFMAKTETALIVIEEYINNPNMSVVLEEKGALIENEAIAIILGLCDALEMLHQLNPPIIHRDIKLANIILTDEGIPKLIDYNISRQYKAFLNQDTVHFGTVGYASPEHFGFSQTDSRSDIYSLGIVFNRLLTKKDPKEQLAPGKMGKIIKKSTEMAPEKRYASIKALRKDLEEAMELKKILALQKKITLPIPGFRTGKIWKMILAVFGYWAIIACGVGLKDSYSIALLSRLNKVFFFTMAASLVAFYSNYFHLRDLLPWTKQKNKWIQLFVYAAYTAIIIVLSALIVAIPAASLT